MSRRRVTSGTPRALDPTRARRGSQQAAAGRVAGQGQTVDASGRTQADIGDEFFFDERGRQRLRVDDETVEIAPGSPRRVRAKIADDSIVRSPHGMMARPTADQVKGPKGSNDATVTASLNRIQAAYKAADAAILASFLPFVAGSATLAGGTIQVVVPTFDLHVGTYAVFVGRTTQGASPGHLNSDPVTWAGDKIQIDSTDGSDDADIWWMVVKLT
jgi:hypothetical protein